MGFKDYEKREMVTDIYQSLSALEYSTRMVCSRIPPLRLTFNAFLGGNVEVSWGPHSQQWLSA